MAVGIKKAFPLDHLLLPMVEKTHDNSGTALQITAGQ
jgi:hypothetical protein